MTPKEIAEKARELNKQQLYAELYGGGLDKPVTSSLTTLIYQLAVGLERLSNPRPAKEDDANTYWGS